MQKYIYKKNLLKVPNLIFKINGVLLSIFLCEKLLKIALMSTYIFYKANLPYKSNFSNRRLLQDKTSKKDEYLFRKSFYTFPSLNLNLFFNSAKSIDYVLGLCFYFGLFNKVIPPSTHFH